MASLYRIGALEGFGRSRSDLWQPDLRQEIQIMRENAEVSPRQAAPSILARLFRRRANDDSAARRLAG